MNTVISNIRVAGELPPPLTLYLHLPWCGRKCPYCDFNSHQKPAAMPEREYVDALVRDMENALPRVWGRRLIAVFIGGGTPSLFSAEAIDRLLAQVRALFNLSPDAEVTLEANPDSADAIKFCEFRAAGVNRLSLGVQSFNDNALQRLQRLHDGARAHAACVAAARAFDNFNIDLMHALPAQTTAQAEADVAAAIFYAPTHLSLYQLTLEENTPFFHRPPTDMPDADTQADITDAVKEAAENSGYRQYEISAYARDNRRCAHNLNYWEFGDYLGIGAGAHGKITENGDIYRERRIRHPAEYTRRCNDNPIASRKRIKKNDATFEFFLNALRLNDGFPVSLFTARLGGFTTATVKAIDRAETAGLLLRDGPTHIRTTAKGRKYLNDLLSLFLPADG